MNDFRSALRQLAKNPGFTAVAVLTLALGIGVNSVMFSLVDAVLFRPLPVAKPEQLVRLGMTDERGVDLGGVSYPLLKDLAREAGPLCRLTGTSSGSEVNLSVGQEPAERVNATAVTGNFFPVLGVKPAAGRLLAERDDVSPGGHPVMVLSEAFWQRRWGGDPRVVGKAVRLNTSVFTIVGVAARGFHGTSLESVPDVWIPLTMSVEASPNLAQFEPFERRGFAWVELVGRLSDGVEAAQVKARLDTINARINQDLRIATQDERYDRFRVLPLADAVLEPGRQHEVARSSWLLIGVTAVVLVIACAVAAGLLLVRGEARHRELTLRQALGASRVRVVRQLLAESLLLSAAAAGLGLLLAQWSAELFLRLAPATFPLATTAATPVLESRVIAFTGAVALLSTLAFGLLPAWRASGPDLAQGMKAQGFALFNKLFIVCDPPGPVFVLPEVLLPKVYLFVEKCL
jgi:predicted permease